MRLRISCKTHEWAALNKDLIQGDLHTGHEATHSGNNVGATRNVLIYLNEISC